MQPRTLLGLGSMKLSRCRFVQPPDCRALMGVKIVSGIYGQNPPHPRGSGSQRLREGWWNPWISARSGGGGAGPWHAWPLRRRSSGRIH